MASTNKTTNYDLSQFVSSDKPGWLTDYNADMGKIDTGIKNAADSATIADGKADTNASAIGTIANLTTTAKTDLVSAVNEVNSTASTAQNTANSATSSISLLSNYLNINTFGSMTSATSSNGSVTSVHLSYASNDTNSVGKIYGYLDYAPTTAADTIITVTDKSPFRPSSDIYISPAGMQSIDGVSTTDYPVGVTIKTDGTITLHAYSIGQNRTHRMILPPCLYFIKDFGDTQ